MSTMVFGRLRPVVKTMTRSESFDNILSLLAREMAGLFRGSMNEAGTRCSNCQTQKENQQSALGTSDKHMDQNKAITGKAKQVITNQRTTYKETVKTDIETDTRTSNDQARTTGANGSSGQTHVMGLNTQKTTENALGKEALDITKDFCQLVWDGSRNMREAFTSLVKGGIKDFKGWKQENSENRKKDLPVAQISAKDLLKKLDHSILILKKLNLNQGELKTLDECENKIRTLEKESETLKDPDSLKRFYEETSVIGKDLQALIKAKQAKNDVEFIVKQALSAFKEMGFSATVEGASYNDVTILGQREMKSVQFHIKNKENFWADFSDGYSEDPEKKCEDDAAAFLTALHHRGVNVDVKSAEPVRGERRKHAKKAKIIRKKIQKQVKSLSR